jgi:hypothetical protein
MTMDHPPLPGAPPPPGGSGRRPPTIDLTATEIQSTDPTPKSAGASPDANAAANDSPADSTSGGTGWVPPKLPWLPIAAGVAGGAVVLAGLGIANLIMGPDTSASALNARLAGLEQRVRDVAARPVPAGGDPRALDDVAARLAKLEAALATPRPGATDPALANRIASIEGQVKALGESVSILGRRTDEAVAAARDARQRAEANTAAAAQPGAPAIERNELEALANRVAAVERSEKAVEAELAKRPAETGDRSLRLVVAAGALKASVDRGDPFAAELASVKTIAADSKAFDSKMLAPLEPFATSGVPTAALLARELSGLAPSLLQAAGAPPPRDGGFLEKLQAGAEKLVRIRPIDEVAGNDPAAIVARIEVKASQADISGALAELAKLPAAARAPAETWIKKAELRMAALDASRRISADALSGLSK